jgi:hypothetical protein
VPSTLELLLEIDLMADAHLFISTRTSSLNTILAPLRFARGHEANTSLVVYDEWWPL